MNPTNLAELGSFCRKMRREGRQGEIGLVIGDEYVAVRDFADARTMKTRLDMDRIAAGLGAERKGKVSSSGGYFGALQLAAAH
jgi:hypothetical protein